MLTKTEKYRDLLESNGFGVKLTRDDGTFVLLSGDESEAQALIDGFDPEVKTYIESRREEYPQIEDQLDMIYWDMENGTTEWKDLIKSIKEKYPKV